MFESVTASCAPRVSAWAIAFSSSFSRTISTGTSGAKRERKSIAPARSTMPSSANSISISAEACVRASPRSRASGSQVTCTGWPALRSALLMASTLS